MADAVKNRVEVQQARINLDSNQLNLVGIKNSLKPTLQAFAELTNNGLSGELTQFGALTAVCLVLTGGYGNLLGEIFRRNYPNYSAGFSLNIPLRNRAAQADYATSLIEIRQNELSLQKQINQVRVDVQNAVIGLQQARARYDAAVQGADSLAADLRCRQEEIRSGRGDSVSGGAGSARSCERAELGSAGDGELQPRADRFRSGAGKNARREPRFDGRGGFGQGESGCPPRLPPARRPAVRKFARFYRYRTLLASAASSQGWAQQAAPIGIEPIRPSALFFWRPYRPVEVPPVRLAQFGSLADPDPRGQALSDCA